MNELILSLIPQFAI